MRKTLLSLLIVLGSLAPEFAAPTVAAQTVATIQRVSVLHRGPNFELEIQASQPVKVQPQVVTGPDRLVFDFPHAVPGRGLHPMIVNVGQVTGIRMGLFASKPPIARIVLDLKSPQRYQVIPAGNKVLVKLLPDGSTGAPAAGVATPPAISAPAPKRVEVDFANGKLRIVANHATLAEVLSELQRSTGASVAIPAGAEQQQVIVDIGPGPVRDVLTALLDGSPYNFILMGSATDPGALRSLILTAREGSADVPVENPSQPQAQATVEPPPPDPLPPEPPPPVPPDNPPDAAAPGPDTIPPPPQ